MRRSRRRAPTSGTISSPRASTQAMAICAGVAPRFPATSRSASTRPRLWSRFSALKRGECWRKSPGSGRPVLRPMTADQAAREDAIGGDADAELAADGEDFLLDAPRDQRVLDLQVGDRMDGIGAADRLRPDLGEADIADVAALDQVGDGADRLLDRHVRIETARAVDVDVVGAEALQRVGDEGLGRRRPRVDAEPAAIRSRGAPRT